MTDALHLEKRGRERPILFSDAMVRAILEGRKLQTRRVIKPQPPERCFRPVEEFGGWWWTGESYLDAYYPEEEKVVKCPYGQPETRLWVREAWKPTRSFTALGTSYVRYRADDSRAEVVHGEYGRAGDRWRPSIHMPRWASRITLELTEVRVQRLQDISEAEAKAEGAVNLGEAGAFASKQLGIGHEVHRLYFQDLWNSINSKRGFGWNTNPWVWALSFRRLQETA